MARKWIWKLADNGWADWICPACGATFNEDIHVHLDYDFCPYCGTDMREESEDLNHGGWIPCSERLPEKEDVYLVTIQVKSGELYILTALWSCPLMPEFINDKARWCCPPELDDFDMDDIFHVIAWMPLPEPYKGGDTE